MPVILAFGLNTEWLPALIVYMVSAASYAFMQKRDFKRNPDKARRYEVLPLHYKLACWVVVLPMIVAVPLILLFVLDWPYLAVAAAHILGLAAFASLEIACDSVYRRHGLWD